MQPGLTRVFLCFKPGVSQHPVKPFEQKRKQYYQGTSEDIQPEIGHPVEIPTYDNDNLGKNGSDEDRIPPDEFKKESQQENSEHIAIKDRSYNIHKLYQVIEEVGYTGDDYCNYTPEQRKSFGCPYIVFLGKTTFYIAFVKVQGTNGAKGIKFGGG